ncbi:MAG: DUF4416 family protein [Desulfobacula sp.]|nr:DUF4416 family protein [Desulfobacula sp.]
MSIPKKPDPAKLVIGCFMNDKAHLEILYPLLEGVAGPVDMISAWLDFNYTVYYAKEMGSPLFRKVFVFKNLMEQKDLAGIKEKTNAVEKQFAESDRRCVNIDPGYLLASRFVLATGKDYSHRIYIGKNIYADLTLMYTKRDGFVTLDWTYPDYASKNLIDFLSKARNKYLLDLKVYKGTEHD